MKIGILQTGHAPDNLRDELGDYDEMFRQLLAGEGFTFDTYRVTEMEFPESATAADGWLITGSRHGAYEDHAFIPPLEELIRDIYAKGVPLVGVCFGHQIVAQALGGKVEKFKGGWSVGPTDYQLNGERVALNAWHQDQVTEIPNDARVVGHSDFCANAALLYGDKIYTVQPHPEYDNRFIGGLIRTRGPGLVPDAQLEAATLELDRSVDQDKLARQFAEFFKQPRKVPHV